MAMTRLKSKTMVVSRRLPRDAKRHANEGKGHRRTPEKKNRLFISLLALAPLFALLVDRHSWEAKERATGLFFSFS